jgi:hypothetical protein
VAASQWQLLKRQPVSLLDLYLQAVRAARSFSWIHAASESLPTLLAHTAASAAFLARDGALRDLHRHGDFGDGASTSAHRLGLRGVCFVHPLLGDPTLPPSASMPRARR